MAKKPKTQYVVTYTEVHEVAHTVYASSPEEAKQFVKGGLGTLLCDDGSDVNDIEDWTVEEYD